ncbi:hypothetical protein FA95DRAFT_1612405 [Auriscalpium vulgare]|uniref:Uncharacterized protein n=1 Tax=Auriscalpium vulgare TaxID=40419 RepID=A0ACB8R6M3_9AGAM|nr:hypothetical protein FA95DRAFT_1612405 [Auriscalpium vulgare]
MEELLSTLISEAPSLYLDELDEWAAVFHDIPISITSLHENLHAAVILVKILRKTAPQRDEATRVATELAFTDESSFDNRTLGRSHGRAAVVMAAVQSKSYEGGLSLDGYFAI